MTILEVGEEIKGIKANSLYIEMENNGDMYSEANSKVAGFKWHTYCESGEYLVQAGKKDIVTAIKRIK